MDVNSFLLASLMTFSTPQEQNRIDLNDLSCMSKAIYFEAGNEPDLGKVAVGHVILNRLDKGSFGDSVCEVVYEKKTKNSCQFSWTCDKKSDNPLTGKRLESRKKLFERSIKAAMLVLLDKENDPTNGALYFYSSKLDSNSKLAKSTKFKKTAKIGGHVFLK